MCQYSPETVNLYIQAGNYKKAEALLLEAIKTKPSPELKDKLGEVYGYQLKWNSAMDIYGELSEAYPDNAEYLFRYGGVLAKKAQNSNPFLAFMYVGRIKSSFKTGLEIRS